MVDRKKIEQEGWEKRGVFDEPRLSEIVNMYEEAGFDVMTVDFDAKLDTVCSVCFDAALETVRYKVVFTKRKK